MTSAHCSLFCFWVSSLAIWCPQYAGEDMEVEIIVNRVRWEDIEKAEQQRIIQARKDLAWHVGKKIIEKLERRSDEQTAADPV